jgi:hypothetical protein
MKTKKNNNGLFFANTKELAYPPGDWAAEMERLDQQANVNQSANTLLKKAQIAF